MKPKIIIIGCGAVSHHIARIAAAEKVTVAVLTPQQAHSLGRRPMQNQLTEPEPIFFKNRILSDIRIAFDKPRKGHIRPYTYHR